MITKSAARCRPSLSCMSVSEMISCGENLHTWHLHITPSSLPPPTPYPPPRVRLSPCCSHHPDEVFKASTYNSGWAALRCPPLTGLTFYNATWDYVQDARVGMAKWGEISVWDTSNIGSMELAFSSERNEAGEYAPGANSKATSFHVPRLNWDTSSVTKLVRPYVFAAPLRHAAPTTLQPRAHNTLSHACYSNKCISFKRVHSLAALPRVVSSLTSNSGIFSGTQSILTEIYRRSRQAA